jgi:hypothetical protein
MQKSLKILFVLFFLIFNLTGYSQLGDNVYDYAPSADVTTTGNISNGGATARSFFSLTSLTIGQSIVLNFKTSILVHTVKFGTFWSSDGRFIPSGYNIDYSNDGINYINVVSVTGNNNINPSHAFGIWAQYWRLTVTGVQSGQLNCNIAGLQFLSSGVGAATNNSFWNISGYNSNSINYNGGNVGIGTNNPSEKLSINGALESLNDKYGEGGQLTLRGGIYRYSIDNYGGNGMRFFREDDATGSNGLVFMNLLSNGNLLIGKTSQSNSNYKLDVAGNIRANKLVINTTGADYVFNDGYRLRPLLQVENYIKQNKHLPGVEPAKKMQEEGMSVGETQTKLLEKIEELTLYIIEQNKEMGIMKKEINQLKKMNHQLQ